MLTPRTLLQRFHARTPPSNNPVGSPTVPATAEEAHGVFSPVAVNKLGGPTNWTSGTNQWNANDTPMAGDLFAVSHSMTISGTLTAKAGVVLSGGTLVVASGGELVVETLQVMEGGTITLQPGGTLTLGGGVADLVNDPDQYWQGLMNHGTLDFQGTLKTSFVRLGVTPAAGDSTLTFASAVTGWLPGDTVVLPDSRHLRGDQAPNAQGSGYVTHNEEMTVATVAGNGLSCTLTAPLAYDHPAAVDSTSTVRFRPHVMNITRDAVVRSAAPTGVRGHFLCTGAARVNIQYVEFRRMGRTTWAPLDVGTNHIGRYACHMHHLHNDDPALFNGVGSLTVYGSRFLVEGCAVHDAGGSATSQFKWGITVHASHYGHIKGNVVYNHGGAGIMQEAGTEIGDLFEGNFVLKSIGNGGRPDERGQGSDVGYEGTGAWARNWTCRWLNNVVADTIYGVQFWVTGAFGITVPTGPATGATQVVNMMNVPVAQFDGWEIYGGRMLAGCLPWGIGTNGPTPYADAADSTFNDLTIWHVIQKFFYNYECNKLTIDGFICIGSKAVIQLNSRNIGFYAGDYAFINSGFRNFEFHNLFAGFHSSNQSGNPPGVQTFEDGYVDAVWCFLLDPIYRYGSQPGPGLERQTILRNVVFHDPGLVPNDLGDHYDVYMDIRRTQGAVWLTQIDELRIYDYNGVPGDDFQVFYDDQASAYVMPDRELNSDGTIQFYGSPVHEATNAYLWAHYLPDLTYNAAPVLKSDAPNSATPGMATHGSLIPVDAIAKTGVFGKVKAI